jgi:hypothetical protein
MRQQAPSLSSLIHRCVQVLFAVSGQCHERGMSKWERVEGPRSLREIP